MNATLLIYCDEESVNRVTRPSQRRGCGRAGYTVGSLPIASRLERLRGKLIRETELYLSDVESQIWARAKCKPALQVSPAA